MHDVVSMLYDISEKVTNSSEKVTNISIRQHQTDAMLNSVIEESHLRQQGRERSMTLTNSSTIPSPSQGDPLEAQPYPRDPRGGLDDDERVLQVPKLVLLPLKGTSDLGEYLEWLLKVERHFDIYNISDAKKVKYAITQFEGSASSWWEKELRRRARHNEPPITNWRALKNALRARYVPDYYQHELLKKLHTSYQGSKSVEEYYEEMETTRLRCDVDDDDEVVITRFLAGLHKEIGEALELHKFERLEDAYLMALKVERHKENKSYKSKATTWNKNDKPWKSTNNWEKSKDSKYGPKVQVDKNKLKVKTKGASNVQTKSLINLRCLKCQGLGHYMKDCPNRRTIITMDDGSYRTKASDQEHRDSEHETSDEELEEQEDDGPRSYLVTRKVLAVAREDQDQRENLFHGRCKILGNLCSLIIDSGSCANVISSSLLEQMNLPSKKHPSPYRLQWLHECGDLRVTKMCS
ncbi:PREDICTED: uncharacterized protein LOC109207230 [Nicotiana attenuata]|uniref:uncharacterized protein LOC109207230 n=1 Tax=Nicotiana attenuata TaxID=49451 RepID=UPI0009045ED5|nr:PREDICTED: uncharacterized protein LOC109207230 [Nicotiana attenuata]